MTQEEIRKAEILNRIGETGNLNNEDTTYIQNHHWDFKIKMFVRKKKRIKKISEKELDHIIEHYQDYRIPMFIRRKKR